MTEDACLPVEKRRRLQTLAVWGTFGAVIAAVACVRTGQVLSLPYADAALGPPNPDTWLRLTQVRQWVEGGDFFDHGVRHTNAPAGGVTTPWTRPVDALLALLYFLTPHGIAVNLRLMLAAAWLPPLLCAGAMAGMARAAQHHFRHFQVLLAAIVLMLCNAYRIDYFSPGDADHHGLLSMLWCGVLCLAAMPAPPALMSLATGALLGTMVWISPEGLVPLAAIYALLGIDALLTPGKMRGVAITTIGAALAATAGLFIERPVADMAREVYDSLSIVHVRLLWLAAAGAGFLALVYARNISLAIRTLAVAVAGVAVVGAMYMMHPKFFMGPLVDADPFIFDHFLPQVTEIRPLWRFPWTDMLRELAQPLFAAGLAAFALRHGLKRLRPEKRRFILLLSGLLAITAALTCWEVRWEYYLQPVAIVLAAALLPGIATAMRLKLKTPVPRRMRPAVWIIAVFAITKITSSAFTTLDPLVMQQIACNDEIRYVIQTGQVQQLFGEQDMTLYVPANAGGDVLFFTPYNIIASNYHREGAGLKELYDLETAEFGEKPLPLLLRHHVKGLLYCPGLYADRAWLSKIANEHARPDWLTPAKNLRFFERKGVYTPKPVLFRVEQ